MTSHSAVEISPKPSAHARPGFAKDLLINAPVANPDQTTEEVLQIFTDHAGVAALPVVEGRLPIGLINRNMFMDNLAKPFRREICAQSCIAFMDKSPLLVDQHTTLQDLSFMAVQAGSKALNDGFIVTDGDDYLGIGTGFDLMRALSSLQAHKNRLVMESIDYASLIQKSYLRPFKQQMKAALGDHFIHWAPRDVVGGDFYHFAQHADGFFAAVIDCTGTACPALS
ncbi:CBS domain-containing protein [Methylogaea oryzae]|uniref:CBS domain-containing protein n=1 Tax=Methylogaea oryzae TaxID=1295382 RepID=UPI0009E6ABAD|nr:CBS domain-containing protein [Methylogaea oryzae]